MSDKKLFMLASEKRFLDRYSKDKPLDLSSRDKILEIRSDVRDLGGFYVSSTDWHLPMKLVKDFIIHAINDAKSDIVDIHCSSELKLKLQNHFWYDDFCYLGTRIRLYSHDGFDGWHSDVRPEDYKLLYVANNIPLGWIERGI